MAKQNQEEIAKYGIPPNAKIVKGRGLSPQQYNIYIKNALDRLYPKKEPTVLESVLGVFTSFGRGVTAGVDNNFFFGVSGWMMGSIDDGTTAYQIGKTVTDVGTIATGTFVSALGMAGHFAAVPFDVSGPVTAGVGTVAGVGIHVGSAAAVTGGLALATSGTNHLKNDASELLQRMQGTPSKGKGEAYNRKQHYGNTPSTKARNETLERDNSTCQYCGSKDRPEADHNPSLKSHYQNGG